MSKVVDTFVAPKCHDDITILYADEDILLINKPSGLLSLSGKNPLNFDSVHYRLRTLYPLALMVHRLDFGTSGVMVLALNKAANTHLTKQFQQRQVVKTYISLLSGHLHANSGCIDIPLAKDPPNFPLQKVCYQHGKAAQSQYKVLEQLTDPVCTKVIFSPRTGRTHQLRIHSRELGHPILGCDLYGNTHTQAAAKRLMLHALTLEFTHPTSGERRAWQSPCPF